MRDLSPGDFLVFQLEAGFGLLRLLAVDEVNGEFVWHLAAYSDLFPSVEAAETATETSSLHKSIEHVALTNRAFESTQVSAIGSLAITAEEIAALDGWRSTPEQPISDRSIRLILGYR
ncbi:MAG TPA: hypothetical protein VGO43_02220 [Pyrinomonadaceae bacterium]|jgi:hypothetical protein|nr:hypothetical protein [Pyrinomonadaceae bacterium]